MCDKRHNIFFVQLKYLLRGNFIKGSFLYVSLFYLVAHVSPRLTMLAH